MSVNSVFYYLIWKRLDLKWYGWLELHHLEKSAWLRCHPFCGMHLFCFRRICVVGKVAGLFFGLRRRLSSLKCFLERCFCFLITTLHFKLTSCYLNSVNQVSLKRSSSYFSSHYLKRCIYVYFFIYVCLQLLFILSSSSSFESGYNPCHQLETKMGY